ncbi:MAG: anaerobic ribonucleoside-triphosphate reductase [Clostridia bacterium]|nr:anaerobic ribonucleoside-triphosphate reductase [Clostridia bacterium]
MRVIKRDGRAVDYDRQKIAIAIGKANEKIPVKGRASKEEIKEIIEYIESLGKKRMLVEDIQDIIEQKLMEMNKFELAKEYIVYRYRRALVRKQNTTDESILGLIRNKNKEYNSNKNTFLASTQRDYIAGEVSRDLTKRLLLPEKITKADEEGILHFHDADYFVQPIFNSSLINIADMLDNGTVVNGKMIETPKSFQVACIVITQIIAAVASNQYGGQSIDLIHLGKYARKSYNKFKKTLIEKYKGKVSDEIIEEMAQDMLKSEIKDGVQIMQYQINTLMTTNGQAPVITLFLHLDPNDEYIKENAMIIEEVIKQRYKGIKNEKGVYVTPTFPKLVYVLDESNNLSGGEYDYLTELAIKCSTERMYPDYISAKKMRENYEGNIFSPMGCRNFLSPWKEKKGNYKFEGRFNQGVVSLNLPQIGIIADGEEEKFWSLLEERLELCKEALMCKHYALLGTTSDISPLHWQHGAISRLEKGEKIDELLKGGYSTLSLGYIGIYEVTKAVKGTTHTTKEGHDFAIKVMKKLKNTVQKWRNETGLGFVLYGTPAESLCYKFAKIDKEKFGTITDITDKGYYTNSYHVDAREKIDVFEKLKFESEFQTLSTGGDISYIEVANMKNNLPDIESFVKFLYDNIQYAEFKTKTDYYEQEV